MQTSIEADPLIPSPLAWSITQAHWRDDQQWLQSERHRYGYLLVSPIFELNADYTYHFKLDIRFIGPGGVTFGLQDKDGNQWLQLTNFTGTDFRECNLEYRPPKTDGFRLVLANCHPDGPAVTRLKICKFRTYVTRETPTLSGQTSRRSLNIHLLEPHELWQGPLLCLTHSQRPVDIERCNRNALIDRYQNAARLRPKVPFHELTPATAHNPWKGQVTVWSFRESGWRRPRLLAHLEPIGYKPQQALWHHNRLWILGSEILEVFDPRMKRLAVFEDPWLAGGHTLVPGDNNRLLISCAASDSILVVNEHDMHVDRALRVPESIYGRNFPLTRTDSVVEHFVVNDQQLTHINSCWPYQNGYLISTLIQGAIGFFDTLGNYRELIRGFVGCHGVRTNRRGQIYFSDSPLGAVVTLDKNHNVYRLVDLNSAWLHDALEIDNHVWAASIADRNQVVIFNPDENVRLHTIDASSFGASTQFVSYGA